MKFRKETDASREEKVDAQWKIMTRLAIIKWRKANPKDTRNDSELAEQFMTECEKEGWCRKVDGKWQLRELRLSKKKLKKQLEELG
jgi:hypothetical protein